MCELKTMRAILGYEPVAIKNSTAQLKECVISLPAFNPE
jgi:hypothetical protein